MTETRRADLAFWGDVVSFRPPQRAASNLRLFGHVQRVEDAAGTMTNLDFFSVHVKKLPTIDGKSVSAQELLHRFLQSPNIALDRDLGDFEVPKIGSDPIGTVVHIQMGRDAAARSHTGLASVEDGSVVLSAITPSSFVFSTVYTVRDLAHPVSGNRQFGFVTLTDGSYVFYTRGVDRPTGYLEWAFSEQVLNGGSQLWRSFQTGLASLVNRSGGEAEPLRPVFVRLPWSEVQKALFQPTAQLPATPRLELVDLGGPLATQAVDAGKPGTPPTQSTGQSSRSPRSAQNLDSDHFRNRSPERPTLFDRSVRSNRSPRFTAVDRPVRSSGPSAPFNPQNPKNPLKRNNLLNPADPNSPLNPANPNSPLNPLKIARSQGLLGDTIHRAGAVGPIRRWDAPPKAMVPIRDLPPIHRPAQPPQPLGQIGRGTGIETLPHGNDPIVRPHPETNWAIITQDLPGRVIQKGNLFTLPGIKMTAFKVDPIVVRPNTSFTPIQIRR